MHADRLKESARAGRGSIAQQFRRRHDWRRDLRERYRFLPCWLASFVIHMVVMILLATLIIPQVNDPFLRPLLLSFATEIVEKPQSQPEPVVSEQQEATGGADQVPLDAAETDVAPEPPASPPPQEELLAAAQDEPQPEESAADVEQQAADAPAVEDPFAVPPGRLSRPVRWLNASSQGAASATLPASLDSSPQQEAYDDIVDRFILYDIGRLTGADGALARRDFEALGPDAIPALVRGLNRSASIHASCPVGVISSRLQKALSQCDDRSLFAYAVSNIGRDVPHDAPHYGRLMSLLNSLREAPEVLIASLEDPDPRVRVAALEQLLDQHGALQPHEKQRVAEALASLVERDPALGLAAHRLLMVLSAGHPGAPAEETFHSSPEATARAWRIHWKRIDQWEDLKRAAPHELHAAIKSADAVTRQAGAYAIAGRRARMTDAQKVHLARELIDMLSSAESLDRDLAQQALVTMAEQDRPRGLSPAQWTRFWDDLERDKLIGPRANAYLGMARRLESRGQVREAMTRYDRVMIDFPNTPAAAQARERLAQLASNR